MRERWRREGAFYPSVLLALSGSPRGNGAEKALPGRTPRNDRSFFPSSPFGSLLFEIIAILFPAFSSSLNNSDYADILQPPDSPRAPSLATVGPLNPKRAKMDKRVSMDDRARARGNQLNIPGRNGL